MSNKSTICNQHLSNECGRIANKFSSENVCQFGYLLLSCLLLYSVIMSIFFNYIKSDLKMAIYGLSVILLGSLYYIFWIKNFEQLSKYLKKFFGKLSIKNIFFIALLFRLIWVIFSGGEQTSDFLQYELKAFEFLNGKIAMNGIWPTGPSLVFYIHYLIFGPHNIFPQISMAIISSIQVILVYKILILLNRGKSAALFAAFILAIWPESILYSRLLGSDVLFSALLLASFWVLLLSSRTNKKIFYLLAGNLMGIAHWMRSTVVIFIISSFLIIIILEYKNLIKALVSKLMLISLGIFIFVIPMIYLNYSTFGTISIRLLSSAQSFGWSLVIGTNFESHGKWTGDMRDKVFKEMQKYNRLQDEHIMLFRDRVARNMALKKIREHSSKFLTMVIKHKIRILWGEVATLAYVFNNERSHPFSNKLKLLADFWHKLLIILCAISIQIGVKRRIFQCNYLCIYMLFALLTTFMHMFVEVSPRYHHMFLPFFSICIGYIMIKDFEAST